MIRCHFEEFVARFVGIQFVKAPEAGRVINKANEKSLMESAAKLGKSPVT